MTGEQLKGKVCLITGAAGRIGGALVERFLIAGATVIAVDLWVPDAKGADNMMCDQGDPQSVLALEAAIKNKYARVDCVVNNGAVGGHRCNFHEKPLSEYEEVMRVNVRGPFLINQAVLRLHLANTERPLSIINMASTAGRIATSLASVYSMSKHALIGMSKNIASEYATQNVRCNSLSPGYMEVPNVQGFSKEDLASGIAASPMKRGGKPMEVADLAVFLASDEASFITGADYLSMLPLPRSVILANGQQSMAEEQPNDDGSWQPLMLYATLTVALVYIPEPFAAVVTWLYYYHSQGLTRELSYTSDGSSVEETTFIETIERCPEALSPH